MSGKNSLQQSSAYTLACLTANKEGSRDQEYGRHVQFKQCQVLLPWIGGGSLYRISFDSLKTGTAYQYRQPAFLRKSINKLNKRRGLSSFWGIKCLYQRLLQLAYYNTQYMHLTFILMSLYSFYLSCIR